MGSTSLGGSFWESRLHPRLSHTATVMVPVASEYASSSGDSALGQLMAQHTGRSGGSGLCQTISVLYLVSCTLFTTSKLSDRCSFSMCLYLLIDAYGCCSRVSFLLTTQAAFPRSSGSGPHFAPGGLCCVGWSLVLERERRDHEHFPPLLNEPSHATFMRGWATHCVHSPGGKETWSLRLHGTALLN